MKTSRALIAFILLGSAQLCFADADDTEAKQELDGLKDTVTINLRRNYTDANDAHSGDNLYVWRNEFSNDSAVTISGNLEFFVKTKEVITGNNTAYLTCNGSFGIDDIPSSRSVMTRSACAYNGSGASQTAAFYPDYGTVTGTLTLTNPTNKNQSWTRSFHTRYGNNQDLWTIQGTIPARNSCEIAVNPTQVKIGRISLTSLQKVGVGQDINESDGQFTITTTCTDSEYSLTFTPAQVSGGCINSDSGVLRFCLDTDDKRLDMRSGSASLKGDSANQSGGVATAIKVTPQRGSSDPVAGQSTGTITITVTPE